MHHWEEEYFDEYYEEKQQILNQIAKEEYEKLLKEKERYEEYRRYAGPDEYYPTDSAA